MGTQAWTPRRLVSENPDTFCCILIRRRLFAGGLSRTSTVDHNGLDHADCTTLRPSPRISTLHFRLGTISRTWSGWRPTQRRRIWKILTGRMSRRAKSADQGRARLKNRAMLAEQVRSSLGMDGTLTPLVESGISSDSCWYIFHLNPTLRMGENT